jgi:hypothetical protein
VVGDAYAIELPRIKPIVPGLIKLTPKGLENFWTDLDKDVRTFYEKHLKSGLKDRILMMSGSLANYSSKFLQDEIFGATNYTAVTPLYFALWTSALDDTFNGGTTGEIAYTSYARLSLTNNTTIFAAGSGTTTYSKTFPSDAAKTWATSTGGSTGPATYLGILDANNKTSADHGYAWCSVTSTTINNGDTPQLAQNAVTVVQD